MAKNHIRWTKEVKEMFIEMAMLSELEIDILEDRIKGKTVTEMSLKYNVSKSTIDRIIRSLKDDYDFIQSQYPDKFPKSFKSKEEIYMDTH